MARFITLLLLIAMALPAGAQDQPAAVSFRVLKGNLFALAATSLNLSYEWSTASNRSWMLTAGISRESPLDAIFMYRRTARLLLERRYYFGATSNKAGTYLAPYIRLAAVERDTRVWLTGGNYRNYDYKITRHGLAKVGAGLTVGYQFIGAKDLTTDLLLGFGWNWFQPGHADTAERDAMFFERPDARFGLLLGGLLN